jgi:protein-S-isoprenylcysteine O-methyltransferase Ste14
MNFDKLQKKAQSGVSGKMTALVGALIVIVLAVSLAPEMFSGVADLEADTNTPDWLPVVLYVIIASGIVFLIWKAFSR